ncbi:rCG40590 [Rattus norvegicus]|uniref:RCG40590 n=1 Tax=Rattus norvegicus TaxID=10116 RepID=A6I785_RAT|nr:rCG40590 [Rattus norvegicus]
MNVDPSYVYRVPQIRMLLGLTSLTMHLDSLEIPVNSTLMNVPVSRTSMKVYVWMQKMTTTVATWLVDF